MIEPSQVAIAVNVGAAFVKHQNPIVRFALRTWRTWARHRGGPEKILIVGGGGTGKSTLLKLITGSKEKPGPKYDRSHTVEDGDLVADVFGQVWAVPGQDNPFDLTGTTPGSDFVAREVGRATGLVFVTAFGYNSVPNLPAGADTSNLRERSLNEEDRIFASLEAIAGRFDKLRWVLLILNKRDIWVGSEQSCLDHYEDRIAKLKAAFAASGRGSGVRFSKASVSFISANVRRADSSIVYQIDPSYDDTARQADVEHFLGALSAVASAKV